MKVWSCKIGECDAELLPDGADAPMRAAVERAYRELTGFDAAFNFSGWGAELSEPERAVVEKREPSEEHYRAWQIQQAAPDLYEALSDVEFLFARPGENSVERFERLAEAFYRDTGLLAPGKDAPAAGGQPDREERSEKYDAWIDAKIASARAALQRVSPQAQGQQNEGAES